VTSDNRGAGAALAAWADHPSASDLDINHLSQDRRLGRATVDLSRRDGSRHSHGDLDQASPSAQGRHVKTGCRSACRCAVARLGLTEWMQSIASMRDEDIVSRESRRSRWFPIAGHSINGIFSLQGTSDGEMSACRRPKQRWIGWLAAIAYLFASLTPSLALVPVNLVDLPVQCAHEIRDGAARHHHHHDHAGAKAATHSHDAAREDCHDDQNRSADDHAGCCGSALCLSAVSPQAPSLPCLAVPRSRYVSQPGETQHEEACRRLYRPPIA